jgi:hypothetical protein
MVVCVWGGRGGAGFWGVAVCFCGRGRGGLRFEVQGWRCACVAGGRGKGWGGGGAIPLRHTFANIAKVGGRVCLSGSLSCTPCTSCCGVSMDLLVLRCALVTPVFWLHVGWPLGTLAGRHL